MHLLAIKASTSETKLMGLIALDFSPLSIVTLPSLEITFSTFPPLLSH
jgi:hypothetical protein